MTIRSVKSLVAEANGAIETLPAPAAVALAADPTVTFVDVRETEERTRTGSIPGAVDAPRGFLEFLADPASERHDPGLSPDRRLVLFCASGGRSALAAKTLMDMGFDKVGHIAGGFPAWTAAAGPTESIAAAQHKP